jgi:hypothetical protein
MILEDPKYFPLMPITYEKVRIVQSHMGTITVASMQEEGKAHEERVKKSLLCCVLFFRDRVSLYSTGWP